MDEVQSFPTTVDLLIAGGPVMTMDGGDRIVDPGGVAIDGERIVFVGEAEEAKRRYRGRRFIDGTKKLTMPGLVDTYSHAGHGLAKAIFHGTHGWPSNVINFHGTTEDWWAAEAALTACERVRFGVTCGVTTLGATPARTDHPRYALANARAVNAVGIRGFVGVGPPDVFVKHIPEPYSVTDYDARNWPSTRYFTYEDTLEASKAFIQTCRSEFDAAMIRPFFASPYVFGRHPKREGKDSDPTYLPEHMPELKRRALEARAFADEHDVLIHTHMFRSTIDFAVREFGRDFVDEILGPDVVVAHANAMTPSEITVLAETGTKVASSPSTGENFWYGRCPVPEMLAAGVNVSIATDGNAPRFSMDLFKDIYRALFLAWVGHGHQQIFPVGKALRMVTAEAAQVIGMDEQIGSLEVGKLADVILIDLNRPHLVPSNHLPNLVAYYVNGNDVDTTIVNGKVLMSAGILESVNQDEVIENARHQAELAFSRVDITKYLEKSRSYWRDASYE